MTAPLVVTSTGAVCSIGVGARQVAASVRAGLCRFRRQWWGAPRSRATVAMVDEAVIDMRRGPAAEVLTDRWAARIATLAAIALQDVLADAPPGPGGLVVRLAVPDLREGSAALGRGPLAAAIAAASGWSLPAARLHLHPGGRAAIFDALSAARADLSADPTATVLCGGVDSYASAARIEAERGRERTIDDDGPCDGRVLGEGAAFVRLAPSDARFAPSGPAVVLEQVGLADDPGHRFADEPARGEGLADALEDLRSTRPPSAPIGFVAAGLTGEAHDAKLWSTACIRHRDLFAEDAQVVHPADRFGDPGAALGALLVVDTHARLVDGRARGPALTWCGSDHGRCGCATLRPGSTMRSEAT